MTVVFLTRKYPPRRGGMETFSFELFSHYVGKKIIFHAGRKQRDIFWTAPLLFFRALLVPHKQDVVFHIGDLVLGPVGALLHLCTRRPVVVTVHGLELRYRGGGKLYSFLIQKSLQYLQHAVCVSDATAELLGKRGFSQQRTSVISHGVTPLPQREHARTMLCLRMLHGVANCEERLILLFVGRLVPRKGVAWFLEHVFPLIQQQNPLILIAGNGPERDHIVQTIDQHHLRSSVRMLGEVHEDDKSLLYQGADLFLMPNIPTPDDIEGFGFVALEAAAAGLPAVASRLEGIPNAIHDEQNGVLVPPQDAQAFADAIARFADTPEHRAAFGKKAQAYTLQHFRWETVSTRYAEIFHNVFNPPRN